MGWAAGLILVCLFLVALAIIACVPRPKWLKRLNAMERYRDDQRKR